MKKILALLIVSALFISCNSGKRKLHVYSWSDYFKPELVEKFETLNRCRVVVDTFDSNESMYAKLKAGATGYDVITPSNYVVTLLASQNMIRELELTKIPNTKFLDMSVLPGKQPTSFKYSVPYVFSFTGIGYRKDRVSDPQPTWAMFGRQDLAGRMIMLNDPRDTLGAALKFLGYSINTTDESEIWQAAGVVTSWKRNLSKFESEQYKNGLASAEFLVVQGFNGDILRVMNENPNVGFLSPEQGMCMTVDHLAIAKEASEKELAHAFINFMLEPQHAAQNMQYLLYCSPNRAAYDLLPPELKNNPVFLPPADIRARCEILQDVGPAIRLYNEAWDAVKAAS